eukprot:scaffold5482_cov189-Ochromonas_danica.AAC.1
MKNIFSCARRSQIFAVSDGVIYLQAKKYYTGLLEDFDKAHSEVITWTLGQHRLQRFVKVIGPDKFQSEWSMLSLEVSP